MQKKILVISDTHGVDEHFLIVKEKEYPYDTLLHAGDMERSEAFYRENAGAPVYLVAGNNDFRTGCPDEMDLTLDGCRFFLSHGHRMTLRQERAPLRRLLGEAMRHRARVVVFGHTHRPMIRRFLGIWFINPGSLAFNYDAEEPSYITMTLRGGKPEEVTLHHLK